MARNVSVSSTDPTVNGQQTRPGDANEPPAVSDADLSFDPAELEADTPATPSTPADRDLFDPKFLGLSQDFAAEANVARKWDIIKVEKPTKSRVFRVHPDPRFRLKTVLLILKEDNETYLVLPQLRQTLAGESLCGLHTLLACITKAGTPFLWPIHMADSDGKWNIWHQSAWQIAEKAQHRWCRMQANRDAGHYVAEYDQRPPAGRADQQARGLCPRPAPRFRPGCRLIRPSSTCRAGWSRSLTATCALPAYPSVTTGAGPLTFTPCGTPSGPC